MLPDIQSLNPPASFSLNRVGVRGIKKPIFVSRPGRVINLIASIDAFVDLPPNRKGSDMSRSVEIVSEIVDSSSRNPYSGIEYFAEDIVKKLLEKHEYASYAEAHVYTDYFLERARPSGKKSIENYTLFSIASQKRNERVRKCIGVEVTVMTVCPCAMENIRALYFSNQTGIPMISHNQRGKITIMIDVFDEYEVDADDLIDIAESSASSPTFEILKREEEAKLVLQAHKNPKFVEDIVREALHKITEKYAELPDNCSVLVKCETEESIHKHNAFAERVTTIGELKRSLEFSDKISN